MQNDLQAQNKTQEPTAAEFLREYEQWNFIKVKLYAELEHLLAKIKRTGWNDDKRYELTHIVHRWLIHINEHYNDVPKYDWFCLLPAVSADHPAVKFLMDAIMKKKNVKKNKMLDKDDKMLDKDDKMFVKDDTSAEEVISKLTSLLEFIEKNHASIKEKYVGQNVQVRYDSARMEFVVQDIKIRQPDYHASIQRKCADKFIDLKVRYDSESKEFVVYYIKIRQSDRVAYLVKKGGLRNTIRMLLRYESLGMGSYQWGMPQKFHRDLYIKFGVKFEGFSSPMTSRYIDAKYIESNDAKFCSLFPDTDSQFGSLGDFFQINMDDHKGGWSINAPFENDLMLRAAQRMIETLDSGKHWFFICSFPRWTDDAGWQLLNGSGHRRKRFDIKRKTFDIEEANGKKFPYPVDMSFFVLGWIDEAMVTELKVVLTEMRCVFIDIE